MAKKVAVENLENLPSVPEVDAEQLAAQEAAKQARISELQNLIAASEESLKSLKSELKALNGKTEVKRGPTGVGAFIKDLIKDGKTNDEIMAAVAAEWPSNFTNVNCINWYRNALKNWPDGKRPTKAAKTALAETAETAETSETSETSEAA